MTSNCVTFEISGSEHFFLKDVTLFFQISLPCQVAMPSIGPVMKELAKKGAEVDPKGKKSAAGKKDSKEVMKCKRTSG